jgi:hypothetical protein
MVLNHNQSSLSFHNDDFHQMLIKAEPNVREKILKINNQIFFLTSEHAISKPDNKELDHLHEIFNFILRMKNSFGLGTKKGGFSPSDKYELLKLFLKEKQEIDKTFNELFEIYIERSIK